MNKINVKLENCYGIKNLDTDFDFTESNVYSIYAPNGTMKTSFLKAFKGLQKGGKANQAKDEIHGEEPKINVKIDGKKITAKNRNLIYPIESLDSSFISDKIDTLLINNDIKEKLTDYESKKEKFLNNLSELSGLKISKVDKGITVLEDKILELFNIKSFIDLFEIKIDYEVKEFIGLKYSELFSASMEKLIIGDAFQTEIHNYLTRLDRLYLKNNFLKSGSFSLGRLENIYDSLVNNNFFENGYSINIAGLGDEINAGTIKGKIDSIKGEIETTEFEKLTKGLGQGKGIKILELIESRPDIVKELSIGNIELFKAKIFIGYFDKLKTEFNQLNKSYTEFLKEIKSIKISEEKNKWDKIVDEFKERFYVPFNPVVTNIDKSILGIEIPNIEFQFCKKYEFHNCKDNKCFDNLDNYTSLSREELDGKQVLSQGEKRAMYLLNVLFEIEVRRQDNKQHLLIIDDIADSFDYKNKYAIIQYLFELSQEDINTGTEEEPIFTKKFNIILLTHNFDFFRTCKSRLFITQNYQASKNSIGIEFEEYKYIKHEPWEVWKKELKMNDIIALIPFVRNLIEYGDKDAKSFIILTHILHFKNSLSYNIDGCLLKKEKRIKNSKPGDFNVNKTDEISFGDIEDIFKRYLGIKDKFEPTLKSKEIFKELVKIDVDKLDNNLESKLIIALKIRHESEIFMRKILGDSIADNIRGNQTGEMIRLIKNHEHKYGLPNDIRKLLDDVSIMTPENIHLNSFMYEPILDMSDWHLKELYKKVKALNDADS